MIVITDNSAERSICLCKHILYYCCSKLVVNFHRTFYGIFWYYGLRVGSNIPPKFRIMHPMSTPFFQIYAEIWHTLFHGPRPSRDPMGLFWQHLLSLDFVLGFVVFGILGVQSSKFYVDRCRPRQQTKTPINCLRNAWQRLTGHISEQSGLISQKEDWMFRYFCDKRAKSKPLPFLGTYWR